MTNVFLSYKAEDRPRLKPLVAALEAEGFDVWWDAHIGGGTDWRAEIQQHLDAAACVIVAWSDRSVGAEGRFVRDEASAAQHAGSYVPIKIDAVKPPLGFGETQAIDLIGWKGRRSDPRFVALVDAVNARLTGNAPVVRPTALVQPKVSRRMAIAGGVGAFAVAGVGGWALLQPGAAAASNRIAVMSFSNMSGDPAQAYFSDGIAEELRSALSRVGMQVIGKASCDAVKDLDIPTAAAKLGVAHILTGSVRRSPGTIRIGAQLVNGKDGVEKWAQNYDRAPGDTIKIQSDIAEQVASALSVALGAVRKAALTVGGTLNAKAQDLYLRGQALGRSADSQDAIGNAIKLYDAAIDADPSYGDAYLGKAKRLTALAIQSSNSTELIVALASAENAAKRAETLMPGSGKPAATFAAISAFRLDFVAALEGSRAALAAEPNDASVLSGILNFLAYLDDGARALVLAERLVLLDPLNASAYMVRGSCLRAMRRFREAGENFRIAMSLAPQRNTPRNWAAEILMLLDQSAEARALLAKAPPDDVFGQTNVAILDARGGDRSGAEARIAQMRATSGDSVSYQYGQIYAQLGDADNAFSAFDKAVAVRDPGLIGLKRDPFLDPIRRDPRFATLLKRLKFP